MQFVLFCQTINLIKLEKKFYRRLVKGKEKRIILAQRRHIFFLKQN